VLLQFSWTNTRRLPSTRGAGQSHVRCVLRTSPSFWSLRAAPKRSGRQRLRMSPSAQTPLRTGTPRWAIAIPGWRRCIGSQDAVRRWSWTNSSRPARRHMLWLDLVRHSGEREPSCRRTWSRQADGGLELQRLSHLSTQRQAFAYRPQPSLLIGARGSRTARRDDDRRVDDLVDGQGCLVVARPSAGLW